LSSEAGKLRHHLSSSQIMRTIIDLEDSQASRLDAWAKAAKVSRAEAVRRAVNQMLEQAAAPQGTGFGLWAQGTSVPPGRDGVVLQRALRDEWPE
jgi:hypothetical protein